MRLGLATEFGQRAVPLPLVMDDVLVNFDEDRARRMAIELMTFARTQQVLLFTCHTSTRSMLLDLDPDLHVIDLPVQDVAGGEAISCQHDAAERVEAVTPISMTALEDSVVAALTATGSMSLPELAERLEFPAEQVRRALSDLRNTGRVVMSGHKRGARYVLANVAGS
jgi:hypothetical protein